MGMTSPPITPEQLSALPPELRIVVQAIIEHYEARIASLESELAGARKTPRNSSLPPSSEHPHAKLPAPPAKAKPKSKRKRGGQPGHPKHERALIPTEQCQQVVTVKPDRCRRCDRKLCGHDPAPLRRQVWDLPPIEPHVSEYQLHRLTCTCGARTCAPLPPGVPRGQAGPRLIALVTLLMGCFRQSKRRVALFLEQVLNQPCSPGWVVKLQNQGPQPCGLVTMNWPRNCRPKSSWASTKRRTNKARTKPGCGRWWPRRAPSSPSAPRGPPPC